jgi:hypothetical protein
MRGVSYVNNVSNRSKFLTFYLDLLRANSPKLNKILQYF